VKVAVESVTADSARIVYAFASAERPPRHVRVEARFDGGELHADTSESGRLALRFRPDGHVDFLWRGAAGAWVAGVLHRASPANSGPGTQPVEPLPRRLEDRWQTDTAPNISIGQGALAILVESQNGFEVIGRFTRSGGGSNPCNSRSGDRFRGVWDGRQLALRAEGRWGCEDGFYLFHRGAQHYLENFSNPSWKFWLDAVQPEAGPASPTSTPR
jgi:hypothetical protein